MPTSVTSPRKTWLTVSRMISPALWPVIGVLLPAGDPEKHV